MGGNGWNEEGFRASSPRVRHSEGEPSSRPPHQMGLISTAFLAVDASRRFVLSEFKLKLFTSVEHGQHRPHPLRAGVVRQAHSATSSAM